MKRGLFIKGLLAIMLLVPWLLPGCGEKEQTESKSAAVSGENVKKEAKEAYDAARVYTQEQMQAFRDQAEARLDEYSREIDQLQAKTEKLEEDARAEAEEQLAVLRKKRDDIAEKLNALGSSSGDAWEQLKSGVDAALKDLGNACEKAAAEFSKS